MNGCDDNAVPAAVETLTGPGPAPCGTKVVICVELATENCDATPAKVTAVAPEKPVPVIVTGSPGLPVNALSDVIVGAAGAVVPVDEVEPDEAGGPGAGTRLVPGGGTAPGATTVTAAGGGVATAVCAALTAGGGEGAVAAVVCAARTAGGGEGAVAAVVKAAGIAEGDGAANAAAVNAAATDAGESGGDGGGEGGDGLPHVPGSGVYFGAAPKMSVPSRYRLIIVSMHRQGT